VKSKHVENAPPDSTVTGLKTVRIDQFVRAVMISIVVWQIGNGIALIHETRLLMSEIVT